MKKLFTTFLMMGVALCGWANVTAECPPGSKTVTVNYTADPNNSNELQNLNLDDLIKPHMRNGETLKITGDWANKDLATIGKIVGKFNNNVYLDLSACENMVSMINYTGTGDPDWTSNNFTYSYSNAPAEEINVTKKNYYYFDEDCTKPLESWAQSQVQSRDGNYYWTGWDGTSNGEHQVYPKTIWGYYNNQNSFVEVPTSSVTVNPNNPDQGTAMVQPSGDPFSLSGSNFSNNVSKLNGIAFPDHANFTAIPDNVFGESGAANLASATVGSDLVWIGKAAFKNSQLTEFAFPAGLKVIGGEAFHSAPLTAINLGGCTSLVAIKYEAFEECASATTVTFPSGSTFTFLGNDAFNKSGITTVDMENCTGITEFQSKNNDGSTYKTFASCTALKTIILPPYLTAVPDDSGMGVFNASTAVESVRFTGSAVYVDCVLQNPCTIGDKAFKEKPSLATVTLSNNISSIGIEAFHSAAITTISIPASMEELAKHSFYGCTQLTTVIFEAFDKSCGDCVGAATKVAGAQGSGGQGQGAFEECQAITDVYINTLAEIQCDNNAFDQDISWGAGDAGANFATLHFPKEKTEHYVNLSHYLTDAIVTDPGLFHEWLEDHYDQAINPHKNGWYEFINSGPTVPDGPEYQSIILRTFSDYDYAYLVPQGLRAYVVNKVEKQTSSDNYEVTLQRLNVIPKRTGVILYGHPNGKTKDGNPTLVLTPVKFLETGDPLYDQKYEGDELVSCTIEYNEDGTMKQQDTYRGPDQGAALCRANWDNLDDAHAIYKNYLEPILSADGSTVAIKPYETIKVDGVKKTTFRNFALGRYTSTDYFSKDESTLNDETNFVGFFRMKPQSYKSGYAYLRLTGDVDENGVALTKPEFNVADGGEILVKPDEPAVDKPNHVYPYYWEVMIKDGEPYDARANVGNETYNPKGWWDDKAKPVAFDWREYTLSWGDRSQALVDPNSSAKYFGEFEEDADGVVKIVIPAGNEDGEYYTLQGVRVTNPTKGVYIQNGKKVIIK
jgi:hypothetical protein